MQLLFREIMENRATIPKLKQKHKKCNVSSFTQILIKSFAEMLPRSKKNFMSSEKLSVNEYGFDRL